MQVTFRPFVPAAASDKMLPYGGRLLARQLTRSGCRSGYRASFPRELVQRPYFSVVCAQGSDDGKDGKESPKAKSMKAKQEQLVQGMLA